MEKAYVAYRDESGTEVIAVFSNSQANEYWPFQGAIDLEDPRYQTYYDALPTLFQLGLPTPKRSI